jgi:3-deoxy-D-manno-octulosonic-acid transferase
LHSRDEPLSLGESLRMIWIYRILFLPVFILSIPWVLWHVKRRGGYGKDLMQRFGQIPGVQERSTNKKRIWIQAVSVGEVRALRSFLITLASELNVDVYLTTTTSTGIKVAKDSYRDLVNRIYYFPIDFVPFSRKTWNRIAPDLCILTEGELWPEHIHQAKKRHVPVLLLNARMSDSTFKVYSRLGPLCRPIFTNLKCVIASSESNAQKFEKLGVQPELIHTVGNLKCDMPIPHLLSGEESTALRHELGLPNPDSEEEQSIILCGASTWPGEEAALFKICKQLREEGINLRLLITPRHAERRKEIKAGLESFSLSSHFRSDGHAPSLVEVSVADTTGELTKFLQLADIVYIGKSMPPNQGGQTPIEAAMLKKPIVFGPNMSNFREIADGLVGHGIAVRVQDEPSLKTIIRRLCLQPYQRAQQRESADLWLKTNQGATARCFQLVKEFL